MSIYKESLEYHSKGRKGKIEVIPSKSVSTQHDLSLAYSPGVAEPCRMIAEKEDIDLRVHCERKLSCRDLQWHRRSRTWKYWTARRKASHGRKSDPLQKVCGH